MFIVLHKSKRYLSLIHCSHNFLFITKNVLIFAAQGVLTVTIGGEQSKAGGGAYNLIALYLIIHIVTLMYMLCNSIVSHHKGKCIVSGVLKCN